MALTVLAGAFSTLAYADKVFMTNGAVQEGKVSTVQNSTVTIESSNGSFPIPLSSIAKVEMDTPLEVTTAMTSDDKTAISLLEPILPNYLGLPADWVPLAMGRLLDAYLATSNFQKASDEILALQQNYPNGVGKILAVTGQAKVSLRSGSPENALAGLAPLIADADKIIIPTPDQAREFAPLYLTEGQIYAATKKPELALEYYLKVKDILYRDPSLAATVDKAIADLKKANPNVAVD